MLELRRVTGTTSTNFLVKTAYVVHPARTSSARKATPSTRWPAPARTVRVLISDSSR
jgi:hypothetical protein